MLRRLVLGCLCVGLASTGWSDPAQRISPAIERLRQETEHWAERGNQEALLKARLILGEALQLQERFGEAAREYELALTLVRSRKERHHLLAKLGRCYEKLQQHQRMIAAYEKALTLDRKDGRLWEAVGNAYEQVDLHAKAVEAFQRALQFLPGDGETLFALGRAHQRLGFLDRAIEQYRQSLAVLPRPEVHLAIAECHARQGNLELAIAALTEAGNRLPNPLYDIRLGSFYLAKGALVEAERAWERVLRQDPTRGDIRLQLALLYSSRNRWKEAEGSFEELRQRYPQDPVLAFFQATMAVRQDRPAEALALLTRAAQQTPPAWLEAYLHALETLLRRGGRS